jgi:hypothetical protein
MQVSSRASVTEVNLDTNARGAEEPDRQENEILKYAQVSPEVAHPLRRDSFVGPVPSRNSEVLSPSSAPEDPSLEPASSNQEGNSSLKNLHIILQGDTIQVQTPASRAHLNAMEDIQRNDPALLEPPPTHRDFHVDRQVSASQVHAVEQDASQIEPELSIPVIQIQYDRKGNYDSRKTWDGVDAVDLLARAMLTEENEKLYDPDRAIDFAGVGWVMVNRTRKSDGYFNYAEENLYGALVPYYQFALGGVKSVNGRILPGNAAIVANPELYPRWFGGDPQAAYWKAYHIAEGILNGSVPDPTGGALYFADFYINEEGLAVPFEDGRTRFWFRGYRSYTIPELHGLDSVPWSSN